MLPLNHEALGQKYELFFDYDRPVRHIQTLEYFINVWGCESVVLFLNSPESIHWTCKFCPVS